MGRFGLSWAKHSLKKWIDLIPNYLAWEQGQAQGEGQNDLFLGMAISVLNQKSLIKPT